MKGKRSQEEMVDAIPLSSENTVKKLKKNENFLSKVGGGSEGGKGGSGGENRNRGGEKRGRGRGRGSRTDVRAGGGVEREGGGIVRGGKVGKRGGKGGDKGRGGVSGKKIEAKNFTEGKPEEKENKVTPRKKKQKKKPQKQSRAVVWGKEKLEVSGELGEEIAGRVSVRDSRSLYVRFPSTLTVEKAGDVSQALADVAGDADVRLPRIPRTKTYRYCFMEFKSEEEAMKKKDVISQIEVAGEKFFADFIGNKSETHHAKPIGAIDPFKLHVGNLPLEVTRLDLRTVFHTSSRIDYPKVAKSNTHKNFAFITYKTKEEALRVFNTSKIIKIGGKEVNVTFAKFKKDTVKDDTKKAVDNKMDKHSDPPPLKMKVTKEESEDIADDDSGESEEDGDEESEEEEMKSEGKKT